MKCIILFSIILSLTGSLNAQYKIRSNVFGAEDGVVSNSNFRISSTMGQTFIGQSQNDIYEIYSGFWSSEQILTPVQKSSNLLPKVYNLNQNYPNPFNPSTIITYQIPHESRVTLIVYDILGRKLRVLVNGVKQAGKYNVAFNAGNFPSGIYFYKLDARSNVSSNHFTKVCKMILLK